MQPRLLLHNNYWNQHTHVNFTSNRYTFYFAVLHERTTQDKQPFRAYTCVTQHLRGTWRSILAWMDHTNRKGRKRASVWGDSGSFLSI